MNIYHVFDARQDADKAARELREAGFGADLIQVIGGPDGGDLIASGVDRAHAAEIGQRIAAGATLVLVDAPFGSGAQATGILGGTTPGGSGAPMTRHQGIEYDAAAPLSSLLQAPVLSRNATPLSSAIGLPVLSRGQAGKSALSRGAAPLSSLLGLATLSARAAPGSSLFGIKVLSREAAPLSSKAGVPTLSADAAPLSSRLGLRVLTKQQTFLY